MIRLPEADWMHPALTAIALGLVVAVFMLRQRLGKAGRQKWNIHRRAHSSRAQRMGQWALPVSAGLMLTAGLAAGWMVPAMIGTALSMALVWNERRRIDAFIAREAERRAGEMRHWEVRKPADQRLAHKAALQLQELDRVQSTALRKLMDPHFLFNALNGIVHDLMTREWQRAVHHLKAFHRLAERQIHAGHRGSCTLEEEWSGLKDYLQLEVRRLDRPIRWELMPLPDGKAGQRIPALMVQPLVENALWHGLGGTSNDGPGLVVIAASAMDEGLVKVTVFNTPTVEERAPEPVRPEGGLDRRRHASDLIRQRLRLIDRSGRCGYSIGPSEGGTLAELILPCAFDR